jgi:hypothetical protein
MENLIIEFEDGNELPKFSKEIIGCPICGMVNVDESKEACYYDLEGNFGVNHTLKTFGIYRNKLSQNGKIFLWVKI